ncbi:hypothetical protein G6L16_008915 [Agrobacterium tumefaciens]|uniref:hypothetical protein n=1 Tax=Agrobacterium tumefaciens TaxID=358 RepID=UPI00157252AF|nr:hypothetical protein [Agrobacterium tumefaciens]NSZ63459.1 hypothetical protein [Agrobacterium tumefaciens]NTA69829.1 hypothetical protein [Agrobacterium tumefaciens]WIE36975.1 hypothetical protein G6L16_008915 [Agrobacterium tumefaciens]
MTYDRNSTLSNAQPDEPWTADRLLDLMESIPPVSDPLNGATTLYVHPSRVSDADRINEAAGGRLHIQTSKLASPNVIAGFKGEDCVVIFRTEKKNV